MALGPVIASVSAKQDAPIRRDGRRGRLIIKNPSRRWFVDGGIYTRVCAYAAATWCTVERHQRGAGICSVISAVVETTAERCSPPAGQVGIDCDQVVVPGHKMAAADRVNGPIRRDGRRHVECGPLCAAGSRRRHRVRARRPRKLATKERQFTWIIRAWNGLALNRCRRQQRGTAYLAD